jgi:hypothetical protein
MLYQVIMPDNSVVILFEEEFPELKEALEYMGLDYQASIVEQKMYCISWFDYIDEVSRITWCTEDDYKEKLQEFIDAEIEYEVTEYN